MLSDGVSTMGDSTQISIMRLLRQRPAMRSYVAIRAGSELGSQMLNVAIGWYVYTVTHNPMSLAYVGLAQFLPNIGMVLFAGHAADRFERRKVIALSLVAQTLCLAAFFGNSLRATSSTTIVYVLLIIISTARTFSFPAMSAILPQMVSDEEFPRAVAVSSSVFQTCAIAGPAIGGVIYGVHGPAMFAIATGLYLLACVATRGLAGGRSIENGKQSDDFEEGVLAGVRYVRSNRLILSLISLDLFAVLLGGVTALLPIYAKDILAVGPIGLGCLRGAPGVGAVVVGVFLAHRSIQRGAGKLMLGCVAGFGLATIVFALSKNFWLSLISLAVAGGFDMVSMVIRQTLLQVSTPDAMRGRVSAVNWVFIGASSELGEFESGATAALFGTVPAALLGGLGTLFVVALWSWVFPELPRADRLVAEDASAVISD